VAPPIAAEVKGPSLPPVPPAERPELQPLPERQEDSASQAAANRQARRQEGFFARLLRLLGLKKD
jgi:hypothetical protein